MKHFNHFDSLNAITPVSRETSERLRIYENLVRKWQSKINLVSQATLDEFWDRHILDSAQLLQYIPDTAVRMVDIGSGAGFPGMVLGILGVSRGTLIESDERKSIFLTHVSRETSTNIEVRCARAEQVDDLQAEIVVSRACAPLSRLLELSQNFLQEDTRCLFHKGKNYSTEIEEARTHWDFACEKHPSVTDKNGVILALSSIKKHPGATGKLAPKQGG